MRDVNAILLLILIMTGASSLLVWINPDMAVWLADRLYARAQALRAAREVYRATYSQALASRQGVWE